MIAFTFSYYNNLYECFRSQDSIGCQTKNVLIAMSVVKNLQFYDVVIIVDVVAEYFVVLVVKFVSKDHYLI